MLHAAEGSERLEWIRMAQPRGPENSPLLDRVAPHFSSYSRRNCSEPCLEHGGPFHVAGSGTKPSNPWFALDAPLSRT